MNLAELDAIFVAAGVPSPLAQRRASFNGPSFTTHGDRDQVTVRTWASVDEMCRSLAADRLRKIGPRPGAVLYPSAIALAEGAGVWQVTMPEYSQLTSRGNGMTFISDTTGLHADPAHGGTQITVLDAHTGTVLASWLPPHAMAYTRWEGDRLIVDDLNGNASACDPLTGRVVGPSASGFPEGFTAGMSPEYPNGWNAADGLVLESGPESLTAYRRAT
jgi:hypothetical protein